LIAFIIALFITRVYFNALKETAITVGEAFDLFADDISEILLFKLIGVGTNSAGTSGFLNTPVWMISALLISEFVIVCVLSYKEAIFYNIICPISVVIGIGVWHNAETFGIGTWLGLTTDFW